MKIRRGGSIATPTSERERERAKLMRGDRVFIASGLCTSMLVSSFNNLAEGSCRNSEHTWNGYSYCHVQNAPRKKKVKKCAVSPKDEHVEFIKNFF
jgi:hypothetical protein